MPVHPVKYIRGQQRTKMGRIWESAWEISANGHTKKFPTWSFAFQDYLLKSNFTKKSN